MKGNMTVEASLVFPFCLWSIGVVCCLGIFCYNLAVLKLTAYECVSHSMDLRDLEEERFERELAALLEEKAGERVLALNEIRASVSVTEYSIHADIRAVWRLLFSRSVYVGVNVKKTHPEAVLRVVFAGKGNQIR